VTVGQTDQAANVQAAHRRQAADQHAQAAGDLVGMLEPVTIRAHIGAELRHRARRLQAAGQAQDLLGAQHIQRAQVHGHARQAREARAQGGRRRADGGRAVGPDLLVAAASGGRGAACVSERAAEERKSVSVRGRRRRD